MDYIFISKTLIIFILYLFTHYIYKKIDWHTKERDNKWNKMQTYLCAIFFGIPMILALIAFGLVVFFQKSLEFLASKENYEQVILIFGIIVFYFSTKIYLESKHKLIEEKNLKIQDQMKIIFELKEIIKDNKK